MNKPLVLHNLQISAQNALVFLLCSVFFPLGAMAKIPPGQLGEIRELSRSYTNRTSGNNFYDARIKEVKAQLVDTDPASRVLLLNELFDLYLPYKNPEALRVAVDLIRLAEAEHNNGAFESARLKHCEALIAGGFFLEALDIFKTLKSEALGPKVYFRIATRLFGDLQTYNKHEPFSLQYKSMRERFLDSLLLATSESDPYHVMYSAMRKAEQGRPQEGEQACLKLLATTNPTLGQRAQLYSVMAWCAELQGNRERQVEHLMKSIRNDIAGSIYETTSGRVLAGILLQEGHYELAQSFALRALSDAEFYGAQQRKMEAGDLLPLIQVQVDRLQQTKFIGGSVLLLILLTGLAIFAWQSRELRKRNEKIRLANNQISEQNTLLQERNEELTRLNKSKMDNLTAYFELSTNYYRELDQVGEKIGHLLKQKKYDEIGRYINEHRPKENREEQLRRLDLLFLDMFPNFVQSINEVLLPEERFEVDEDRESMAAELRVFALHRLGINQAERIAAIMGVSKNTVYAYRNRVRSKSVLNADAFDNYIREIDTK